MDDIRNIIANNLAEYRKERGLTQLELAEQLNYSDKAISKWERGESMPDIAVFKGLADFYGITVDDLLNAERPASPKRSKIGRLLRRHKLIIPFLCAGIVWLIATVAFVALKILEASIERAWLPFIYAIPVSIVVLIVFNAIWGNKILSAIIVSLFVWSIPLALTLSIDNANIWYLYLIAVPCQILVALWYLMRVRKTKKTGKGMPQ